jgi:predicted ATPase
VQKEIIVIIGGPGTGKTTIIDGLIAKGHCCYPEISREVTGGKKRSRDRSIVSRNRCFSASYFLKAEKTVSKRIQRAT